MPATAPVVGVVTGESLSEDGLRVPAGRLLQKKADPRWAQDQRAGTQRACGILGVQRARKKSLKGRFERLEHGGADCVDFCGAERAVRRHVASVKSEKPQLREQLGLVFGGRSGTRTCDISIMNAAL